MRASAMGDVVHSESKKNMKEIVDKASNNIELQAILLSTIASYEVSKAEGTLNKKKRGRPSAADAAARDAAGLSTSHPAAAVEVIIPPNTILDRNKSVWMKWSIKLLRELLYYADLVNLNMQWLQDFSDKKKLLEIVEFSWDIKCHSQAEQPDKPATLNKLQLFNSMKVMYDKLGKRMAKVVDSSDSGHVDWKRHGHYQVTVGQTPEGHPQLKVFSQPLDSSVLVPLAVTEGDAGLEQAVVKRNFSQIAAYIETPSDTYSIANFFPKLGRKLRRRLSDEGVAVVPHAGMVPLANTGAEAAASKLAAVAAAAASAAAVASGRDGELPQDILDEDEPEDDDTQGA